MNTETKPLAQRITQGPYSCDKNGTIVGAANDGIAVTRDTKTAWLSPCQPANAELIAEAFNVTHETGKTPRELADDLKACRDLLASLDPYPDDEIEPSKYGVYCEITTAEMIAIRKTLSRTAPIK